MQGLISLTCMFRIRVIYLCYETSDVVEQRTTFGAYLQNITSIVPHTSGSFYKIPP